MYVFAGFESFFSNERLKPYKSLSKSSPFLHSAGFSTNPWIIVGIHSRAFSPKTSLKTGTFLQPRTFSPKAEHSASKRDCSASTSTLSWGKKNCPIPYSPSLPSTIPVSPAVFLKKSWQIWSKIPTPSPVFPEASFPALCSSFSTIESARSTTFRLLIPSMLTTAPIPQLSCSKEGS